MKYPIGVVLTMLVLGCTDTTGPEVDLASEPRLESTESAALPFLQVTAGGAHTCAVTPDDLAYCWGANEAGQLGNGDSTGPETCPAIPSRPPWACSTRPLAVRGGHRFRQVSAGSGHTCGVTTDGHLYCWGKNGYGQLGDGTTTWRTRPVPVVGDLSFRQVSAGERHTCGVTTQDRVYCWGNNGYGQLGDGTGGNPRSRPAAIASEQRFRQVTVGGFHTCALTTMNVVFCWGSNHDGQLGDSSTLRRLRPKRVAGGYQFRQVDAGDIHTCAVTTGNQAFCWGNGRQGELGTGQILISLWPRRVAGGLSFDRVTAGESQTCGETTTNRVYCWGRNYDGELGDGTTNLSVRPVAVAGGLSFTQASAGSFGHTCGKISAAVVYCWGKNDLGQLGDGTIDDRLMPTPVVGP